MDPRVVDIRRRNAYRMEKRSLNKAAGLIQPFSQRASAIDDIEVLLEIIDGQREITKRRVRDGSVRAKKRDGRIQPEEYLRQRRR